MSGSRLPVQAGCRWSIYKTEKLWSVEPELVVPTLTDFKLPAGTSTITFLLFKDSPGIVLTGSAVLSL